jgi:hypothetical protein
MSVHHPGVAVVLELNKIVRRVPEDERLVHFDQPFESKTQLTEHLEFSLRAQPMQCLEVLHLTESDPEVAWIKGELIVRPISPLGEVTYQLITEEVEGDPVWISPRQLAAKLTDVEVLGLF